MALFFEQLLNGLQYGVMLFLVSAGLTLVFGIMQLINLSHGSLYMVGAFVAASVSVKTGSFLLGLGSAVAAAAVAGLIIEFVVLRRLYARGHLDQVLATFGIILFANGAITLFFGRQPLFSDVPSFLGGAVTVIPGLQYPIYRLAILATGVAVAGFLYGLVTHTRVGMLVRAGATNRDMVRALGVDIRMLYAFVFGLGSMLAGLAGAMIGPVQAVQVGMGEQILIMAFVVIIIGGVGSIRGAVVGALLVGIVDTLAVALLPGFLRALMSVSEADALTGGLSSIAVYLLMALVLLLRPHGLFGGNG